MLLVPRGGAAMPVELARRIVDWVKNGGVLVSYGAPGILDQYGRSQGSGLILESAFPGVDWEHRDVGRSQFVPTRDGNPVASSGVYDDTFNAVYEAGLGEGRVVVVDDKLVHGAGELARRFVKPAFRAPDNTFDLCMRHDGGTFYLYALNPSLDETRTGDIELRGRVSRVVDCNLQRPVIVPVSHHDGLSIINLRLAPAEGTLLEICRE
jgi:hypothetical protein